MSEITQQNEIAPGHNPDRLSNAQVETHLGWRLLEDGEYRVPDCQPTEMQAWTAHAADGAGWGRIDRFYGRDVRRVYRTRLTPADLAKARGLSSDQPLCLPYKSSPLSSDSSSSGSPPDGSGRSAQEAQAGGVKADLLFALSIEGESYEAWILPEHDLLPTIIRAFGGTDPEEWARLFNNPEEWNEVNGARVRLELLVGNWRVSIARLPKLRIVGALAAEPSQDPHPTCHSVHILHPNCGGALLFTEGDNTRQPVQAEGRAVAISPDSRETFDPAAIPPSGALLTWNEMPATPPASEGDTAAAVESQIDQTAGMSTPTASADAQPREKVRMNMDLFIKQDSETKEYWLCFSGISDGKPFPDGMVNLGKTTSGLMERLFSAARDYKKAQPTDETLKGGEKPCATNGSPSQARSSSTEGESSKSILIEPVASNAAPQSNPAAAATPEGQAMELLNAAFVSAMEAELRANAHKGDWRAWKPTLGEALTELSHHFSKLQSGRNSAEFAADVANCASKVWESVQPTDHAAPQAGGEAVDTSPGKQLAEIQLMQQMREDLARETDQAGGLKAGLTATTSAAEAKLAMAEHNWHAAEGELKEVTARYSAALQAAEARANGLDKEFHAASDNLLKAHMRVHELADERETLRAANAALKDSLEESKMARLKAVGSFQTERDNLNNRLEATTQRLREMEKAFGISQGYLFNARAELAKVANRLGELRKVEAANSRLGNENDALRREVSSLEKCVTDNETARSRQVRELVEQKEALQSEKAKGFKCTIEVESAVSDRLKEQVAQLTKVRDEQKRYRHAANERFLKTRDDLAKTRAELEEAKKRHSETIAGVADLNYKAATLEANEQDLRAQLAAAQAKLDYVHAMGMRFGMVTSSDKPEPYLDHTWTEDSNHQRMFREWSYSIGWEETVEKLREQLAAVTKELEEARAEVAKEGEARIGIETRAIRAEQARERIEKEKAGPTALYSDQLDALRWMETTRHHGHRATSAARGLVAGGAGENEASG